MNDKAPNVGRFKWLLLNEAEVIQDIGVAYGLAKLYFQETDPARIDKVVEVALSELHELGLIVFFRGSLDKGYSTDLAAVQDLEPFEVATELASGGDVVDPDDAVLFFARTIEGTKMISELPADAIPDIPDDVPGTQ